MKVIEMNEGTKIAYEINGNEITFDNDLSINLEKRERDNDVHIDICYNADRELVIGAGSGKYYVAMIDIPARQYTEEQKKEGKETVTVMVPVPFNIDNCTLSLFSIE